MLVYRHHVPIAVVDDIYGHMLVHAWKVLGPMVEVMREEYGNPTTFEWFQWLVERIEERHAANPGMLDQPAFRAHADWVPTRLNRA